MEKGKLTIDNLELIYHAQPVSQYLRDPLFQTESGDSVWSGDTVSFYVEGEHLPHNGTVSNINNKLQVNCFNVLLNKWEYYLLDI